MLPDGEYRFRLVASDRPTGSSDGPLSAERVSEPVINDHSPPSVEVTSRRGGRVEVRLVDAWSPLRRLEKAVDAGEWLPLEPADGLLDGRRETVAIELPDGASSVLLRVMDAAFNSVTVDLLEEAE